jgi:very-short-patch-repair endonuclease
MDTLILPIIPPIDKHRYLTDKQFFANVLKKFKISCFEKDGEVFTTLPNIINKIGLTNGRSTTQNYTTGQKCMILCKTPGGLQKTTCLTREGVFRLLCGSRRAVAVQLCKELGIHCIKTVVFEVEVYSRIKSVFPSEEIIYQYQCDNYYVDIYFPIHHLIVEVDEIYHNKPGQQAKDDVRQKHIEDKLQCETIRIKQNEDIFEAIGRIQEFIQRSYRQIDAKKLRLAMLNLRIEELKNDTQIQQTKAYETRF